MLLTVVNAFGAQVMGRSETLIVVIKVAILVLFAAVGLWFIQAGQPLARAVARDQVDPVRRGRAVHRLRGLRADHQRRRRHAQPAEDAAARALHQRDPGDRDLPGRLADRDRQPVGLRDRAGRDYALAEAAKPFLGEFGFRLIAIAALFSTASAINATLFGSANVCYMIARDGELPTGLSRTEWKQATGGLLLTAGLVVLVMLLFDLSGIAMMGSAAFLLVYAAVNAGHLRVLKRPAQTRSSCGCRCSRAWRCSPC